MKCCLWQQMPLPGLGLSGGRVCSSGSISDELATGSRRYLCSCQCLLASQPKTHRVLLKASRAPAEEGRSKRWRTTPVAKAQEAVRRMGKLWFLHVISHGVSWSILGEETEHLPFDVAYAMHQECREIRGRSWARFCFQFHLANFSEFSCRKCPTEVTITIFWI